MNKALEFLKSQVGKEATNSPSPLMRWLNPVIISVEEGKTVFEYTIREEWLNPAGNLHGGITAAIIDDAIGATVFTYGEPFFYATVNNAIDYLGTAKSGQQIIAKTSIIKKGKQMINAQCEVWNYEQSRILAKGNSNLLKTGNQK